MAACFSVVSLRLISGLCRSLVAREGNTQSKVAEDTTLSVL